MAEDAYHRYRCCEVVLPRRRTASHLVPRRTHLLRTRVQRITRRIADHRRLEANRGAIPHAAAAFEGVHRATLDITPHLQHPRPVLHMERDGCARAEAPDAFDQCAAA